MDWNIDLKQMLATTAPLIQRGELMQATQAIQRALGARTAHFPMPASAAPGTSAAPARAQRAWHAGQAADVQDVEVVERAGPRDRVNAASAADAAGAAVAAQPSDAQAPGSFERIAFSAPGGAPQDHYWLYVPPRAASATAQPMALVLMLHGCTQNPQDFATGTAMNDLARTANALVLYPAQAQQANPKGCWNWFRPEDQLRGAGEPATLVAMVRDVMRRHPVDERLVYVAGLSAGGAMAALLAREYPEVFAAAGVHSGLQPGAARNVMGALSAMKNGAKLSPAPVAPMHAGQALPALIVFHGDADRTVDARNAEQLVQAALAARGHAPGEAARAVQSGQSAAGQRYTRTRYTAAASPPAGSQPGPSGTLVEQWTLHGAGHAWSGGDARGSHTDPRGVNASQEMLRFFMEHPRRR